MKKSILLIFVVYPLMLVFGQNHVNGLKNPEKPQKEHEVIKRSHESVKSPYSLSTGELKTDRTKGLNHYKTIEVVILTPDWLCNQDAFINELDAYEFINASLFPHEQIATMTVEDLLPFDVVIAYNNYQWDNPDHVGNVLAEYIDQGKKLIECNYIMDFYGWQIGGKYFNKNYSPWMQATTDGMKYVDLGEIHEPNHPVFTDVENVSTVGMEYLAFLYHPGLVDGTLLADWSDGWHAIAEKNTKPIIAIQLLPMQGGNLTYTDDGTTLFVNAIVYLASMINDDAPAAVSDFIIIPGDKGALYADLSWTNPDETYAGNPLTELDAIYVYRNNELIHTIDNPEIGGDETYHDDNIDTYGLHTYIVVGENAHGHGVFTSIDAYIGEDVPAIPENIKLFAIDNNGLITWDAPTEGQHGGYFTGKNITYTVVRFPCDKKVATNIHEKYFLDKEVPGTGTYYYTITSNNDAGEGGTGESNESALGPYYELPFSENFTGVPVNQIPEEWEVCAPLAYAWNVNNSNNAGGEPPEMRLNWSPSATGIHYLKTPPINTFLAETVKLEFKNFLKHYDGPYTLKVVTIVRGEEYLVEQWINPNKDLPATQLNYILTEEDHGVGYTHFQLAWVIDGNNYNLYWWCKDNIQLDIDMLKETFNVLFIIEDEKGNTIDDALLICGPFMNSTGNYLFELPVGVYEYIVEKEGYFNAEGEVEVVDEDVTMQVTLYKQYTVTFDITDEYGNEIVNAVVTFDDMVNDPGNYVFEPIKTGIYEYTVEKEGYPTVEGEVIVEEDITIEITMSKIYTVTFDVKDEYGDEITDAVVTFDGETNDPGDYVFDNVVEGDYNYIVEKEGYITVEEEISVEENKTVDVTLFEAFTLTLSANPETGGTVEGAGEYKEAEVVTINAIAGENDKIFKFVEWTGDTDYVDDPDAETTTVTMPASDIELTANFQDVTSVEKHTVTDITVFPNPTREKFTVESSEIIKQIRLINISGQVVKYIAVNALNTEINVSNMHHGIYFIQVQTANGVITERLQIAR